MKFFQDLKPVMSRDNWFFVAGIVVWLLLTVASVTIMALALMAFVGGAMAAEHEVRADTIVAVGIYDPTEKPYREAIQDVEACLGAFSPGRIPIALQADFRSETDRFCAAYESATNTIYVNLDRAGCASIREDLAHELVHAKGFKHHNDPELLDTHFDEHFVQMKKCGLTRKRYKWRPLPQLSRAEGEALGARMVFEGTTSSSNVKRLALGIDAPLSGPLQLGARIGAFNWINVRVWDEYSPFGQLELAWRVDAGPVYARVAQGAALVAPGNLRDPDRPQKGRHGLATIYQFPTSIELGLQAAGFHIGVLGTHYSNGGVGQGGRVYNGFGVSIGRAF